MTFDQIKRLALLQLDEDPGDMDELADLLSAYVNEGYQIAVREYLKPREEMSVQTDENGFAPLPSRRALRIVELHDEEGRDAWFCLLPDGRSIETDRRDEMLYGVCEVCYPAMKDGGEEPRLPVYAHTALADYCCYRMLQNGNLAKQSRAQAYFQSFMQTMRLIRPQGMGSVTRYRGLYAATDVRRT